MKKCYIDFSKIQKNWTIASKGVRLDIMIEDEHGKLYDVEMQTTDQKPARTYAILSMCY